MIRTVPLLLLALLLATPAAASELEARLVAGPLAANGRFEIGLPFDGAVPLSLRLTNRGTEPMQVPRATCPLGLFHELEVVRIEDGKRVPVPVHPDLYPFDDRKPPARESVTLAPGESVERSLDVLLREGYGLDSISRGPFRSNLRELRKEGRGGLRVVGAFEAVRCYSPVLVVDALAALLNQLTGESFGLSYNEADDPERARAVKAWRIHGHYR